MTGAAEGENNHHVASDNNGSSDVVSSLMSGVHGKVARWFVFKPKIPIWVNFGGP
jgi:hypothetical protein